MGRRHTAVVCIALALAAQVALPAMHAVVHGLEAAVARTHAKKWRVEGQGDGHRHGHGHGHEHPGDRPGEHGTSAPEHGNAILVAAAPPVLPPPHVRIDSFDPPALRARVIVTAARSAHTIRGPPVA